MIPTSDTDTMNPNNPIGVRVCSKSCVKYLTKLSRISASQVLLQSPPPFAFNGMGSLHWRFILGLNGEQWTRVSGPFMLRARTVIDARFPWPVGKGT